MEQDKNPYQAPLPEPEGRDSGGRHDPAALESFNASLGTLGSGTKGVPEPLVLAWVGVVLAIGVIGSIVSAITTVSIFPSSSLGVIAVMMAFTVPPLRLAWVVWTATKRRRYERAWTAGERSFVQGVWLINVVLLCIDGLIIMLFATCLVAITQ